MRLQMRGLLVLGMVITMHEHAYAHEWYSGERNPVTDVDCCGGKDCAPIAASRVQHNSWGYIIDGRWFIQQEETSPSKDQDYHICISGGELRCFFYPVLTM